MEYKKDLFLQMISNKTSIMVYKKRILDKLLERKLKGCGAVLMEGPKWCGKTTTCEQQAKSALYMADPEHKKQRLRKQSLSLFHRLLDQNQDFIESTSFPASSGINGLPQT